MSATASGAAGPRAARRFGRGRRAALSIRLALDAAARRHEGRIVRHHGKRFRSAPLSKHVAYLKREGVTRDGADARMFDAASDDADDEGLCRTLRG